MGEHDGPESIRGRPPGLHGLRHRPAKFVEDLDEQEGEDVLFALEVVVERRFRHARCGRDVLHLGGVESEVGEQLGGDQDLLSHPLWQCSQRPDS